MVLDVTSKPPGTIEWESSAAVIGLRACEPWSCQPPDTQSNRYMCSTSGMTGGWLGHYPGGVGQWDDRERAATVALLRRTATEKGERELVQQLTEGASTAALLRERLAPVDLFSDPVEEAITQAKGEIASWEQDGIQVIALGDDHYPHRLRDVFDRPLVLFARGTVLEEDNGVAVVGSRAVSSEGRLVAAELATRLVERGLTVVSGLAAGVDAAAHRAALKAGGRTVAVIGTGICKHFPPENRDLHREIAVQGAVFSQFWPDRAPDKTTFPLRNGTMSGYSLATIIVEASEKRHPYPGAQGRGARSAGDLHAVGDRSHSVGAGRRPANPMSTWLRTPTRR